MDVPSAQSALSSADAKSGPEIPSSRPCRLLSLAPELRNEIYELAFTCNDAKIDLPTAAPPSSALLRCCRQIHCEAEQIFQDSVRQYYTKGHFRLLFEHKGEGDDPYATLRKVAKTHDINSIRHIQFKLVHWFSGHFYTLILQQDGLIWDLERWDSEDGDNIGYYVMLLREEDQDVHWGCFSDHDLDQAQEIARNPSPSVIRGLKAQIEALLAGIIGTPRGEAQTES